MGKQLQLDVHRELIIVAQLGEVRNVGVKFKANWVKA